MAGIQAVMQSLAEEYPQFVIKDGEKEHFDMRALMIHKGYIKESTDEEDHQGDV